VALTRAKARLYLPYIEEEEIGGTYGHLNSVLSSIVGSPAPDLFGREVIREVAPMRKPAAAKQGKVEGWHPDGNLLTRPPPEKGLDALRERFGSFSVSSYSRIKAAKGGYQAPEVADTKSVVPEEPNVLPGGSASGRMLHEMLELVSFDDATEAKDFEDWSGREEIQTLFLDALERYDKSTDFLENAEELVFTALTTSLKLGPSTLVGGIASVELVVREMEFLYPAGEGGDLIKGFIDLVFEYEGKIYIVDWKSDLLPSYEPTAINDHVGQNYKLQAELYTLAIMRLYDLTTPEAFERRFGGTAYLFIRGMKHPGHGVYFDKPAFESVLSAQDLEALL